MNRQDRTQTRAWPLSLLALSIISSLATAQGYDLASANRSQVKMDAWKCQRCEIKDATTGEIGVGVAYNDGSDSRFGNTTGTDTDGVVASLEADLTHKKASGYQTQFKADRLGYDAGSASLTTGRQGQYQIAASYRGFAHFDNNDALSPYRLNDGSWQLPSQWQSAATTDQMNSLNDSLMATELKLTRDRYRLDAAYSGSFYEASLGYQHEKRQGNRRASANLLTNSTMLAERVDDNSKRIEGKLYFRGDQWLTGIDAELSHYQNDINALHWQSAFSPTFGAAYFGQSAVAPDNKAYRVAAHSQFSAPGQQVLMHLGFSRMTQDQTYLPATINGPSPMLPAANLDGQVDLLEMKLKYLGRLTPELNLRVGYDYRDRDNKSETLSYPQIVTDSYYSGDRRSQAYDRTRQQASLGAKYRFTRSLYLDLQYQYEHNNYNALDRDSLQASELTAKLNYRINSQWQTWLKAEYEDRGGSEYQGSSASNRPNNPLLRRSYLADRERQRYGLYTSYNGEALSATLNLHLMQDDYTDTQIGLTGVDSQGYDLSASYALSKQVNLNAFINQDWRDSDQAGSNNFGSANWYASTEDKATLIGAGVDYDALLENRLRLGLNYSYSDGQSDTEVSQGLHSPYGSYYATRHNLNAFADFNLSDSLGLRLDWIFEQYQDADWANENLSPSSIPNVLTFGDLSHDYNAHYFGVTLNYQL
ncbi:MtrB/PioB family decaheme-associated outer membrane protein [Shewanella sp. cp20]|uniref:MtrB/PioB family decaheme-associated outer membrane protein n=1 Tax=Shewanella sp. cp20 TaxID=1521167 RepID=UPI00059EEFCB|nr:MtrB/PioB family decaheme-associated outer membrane protein [Shewanella sp. cp20]KIO37370.1 membrane protein [Shewanella sp. cp20]